MSERSRHRNNHKLRKGFHVVRWADAKQFRPIKLALKQIADQDPAVTIGMPPPVDGAGVRLMSPRIIENLGLNRSAVPLAYVYPEIRRKVPSLGQKISGVLLQSTELFGDYRGTYIQAPLQSDISEQLSQETMGIAEVVAEMGEGSTEALTDEWIPKYTIAFIGRNALPGTITRVQDVLPTIGPLQVDLHPAKNLPMNVY